MDPALHHHSGMRSKSSCGVALYACLALCLLAGCQAPSATAQQATPEDYKLIDRLLKQNLFDELKRVVAIETYRDSASLKEADVVARLAKIRDFIRGRAEDFNKNQKHHKLRYFEWKKPKKNEDGAYWVFGLRLGTGKKRIALISHLDTVPPGASNDWTPFTLQKEKRAYRKKPDQLFYVGRGSIDDKGPAIVALNALKAVAQRYDGSAKLDDVTFELLLDTSEETGMALPHYLKENPGQKPDFGLIFDAAWCVRAEKGVERPIFTISAGKPPAEGSMWIEALNTPSGPTNQIAETATATIRSNSSEGLKAFADKVQDMYAQFPFDDPGYRRAEMTVNKSDVTRNTLTLVTKVAGAQHGSGPGENRENGANPLVSLANFLAGLVDRKMLAQNEVGRMAQFIAWGWGTRVYGEHHPDLLLRSDELFGKTPGSTGTSYALTRLYTYPNPEHHDGRAVQLEIDIRYAIGHHSSSWDGKTEGFLKGKDSIFGTQVFPGLLARFNTDGAHRVDVDTTTEFPPDIRLTGGESYRKVDRAYRKVTGEACPALAIGGGTDAKGDVRLVAAGPLFENVNGPPINYHGINEGAPVVDLEQSARIIYSLFVDEIESAEKSGMPVN